MTESITPTKTAIQLLPQSFPKKPQRTSTMIATIMITPDNFFYLCGCHAVLDSVLDLSKHRIKVRMSNPPS